MATYIEAPSQFSGNEMTRIGQIYSYLYRLHEQLNIALNRLGSGEITPVVQKQIVEVINENAGDKVNGELDTLRSLIIKNAKYVENEMQSLENTLASTYVAQSDFGEYKQDADTRYVQNALYAEMNTNVEESLSAINDLEEYRRITEGHIRYGIIGTKADGTYDYGIAVGESITTKAVDDDPNEEIIKQDFLAIYAANRLEFWQGEIKLATLEGDILTVGTINVAGSIVQGGWKWDNSSGLALIWIGD